MEPGAVQAHPAPRFGVRRSVIAIETGHTGEPTLTLDTSVVLKNSAPERRDRITGGVVFERAQIRHLVA